MDLGGDLQEFHGATVIDDDDDDGDDEGLYGIVEVCSFQTPENYNRWWRWCLRRGEGNPLANATTVVSLCLPSMTSVSRRWERLLAEFIFVAVTWRLFSPSASAARHSWATLRERPRWLASRAMLAPCSGFPSGDCPSTSDRPGENRNASTSIPDAAFAAQARRRASKVARKTHLADLPTHKTCSS